MACYHCGDECINSIISFSNKSFCCEGCKLVFEILNENNLCSYYTYNSSPGFSPDVNGTQNRFGYLDNDTVIGKLIGFTDGTTSSVSFYIPQMHCSSCIWLLENLNRINAGIQRTRVNFLRKEVMIYFSPGILSLRKLVEMLATIGYEPAINLNDLENKNVKKKDHSRTYRLGVAGFCFGNMMLFSFPEYFSLQGSSDAAFGKVFNYINLGLSLPVFFYCSAPFFRSAGISLKQKFLNIDVPIALGILVMFIRSAIEIISGSGAGYMDTMAGLVFFMLLGRMFQDKTFETLSFERDYKSFFPIAVMCKKNGCEIAVPVSDLKPGNIICIRNEELIPVDAFVRNGEANIDYSFVTGESIPVYKRRGDLIYAGGKQLGSSIELEVVKEVKQSYLTQLWNNDVYNEQNLKSGFEQLVNEISHYFTLVIVGIALCALGYWFVEGNPALAWNAFTAVLIIACPCALAISSPFTLGNILRLFGRKNFYLKNFAVIEKLAHIDTIVFDKTGTLTYSADVFVAFHGELSKEEKILVKSMVVHSIHPLSRMIDLYLDKIKPVTVKGFKEMPGKGMQAVVDNRKITIGSATFVKVEQTVKVDALSTVYVKVDGIVKGYYSLTNRYRNGLQQVVDLLKKRNYSLSVMSGDSSGESDNLTSIFGLGASLRFNQSPVEKLNEIKKLQADGRTVLMIGDGLNDAGALKQSDVGISISDHVNNFSPACDGILDAGSFSLLPGILDASKYSRRIIAVSFIIALIYNVVGLFFAVQGLMSPVFAAILMPLSSITIISFTTVAARLLTLRKLNT